jgi:hypothetical protein
MFRMKTGHHPEELLAETSSMPRSHKRLAETPSNRRNRDYFSAASTAHSGALD